MNQHPSASRQRSADIGRVFHALGDPTRRAIVERLGSRSQSVSQLATPLQITLTAVAQHLQILQACGLVETEKTGRVRSCRLASSGLDALDRWVRDRRQEWEQRLDRLGEILAEDEG